MSALYQKRRSSVHSITSRWNCRVSIFGFRLSPAQAPARRRSEVLLPRFRRRFRGTDGRRSSMQAPETRAPRPCETLPNSGLFVRHLEISVCMGLRGGAGRTRTSNQTIISRLALSIEPTCGFRARKAKSFHWRTKRVAAARHRMIAKGHAIQTRTARTLAAHACPSTPPK